MTNPRRPILNKAIKAVFFIVFLLSVFPLWAETFQFTSDSLRTDIADGRERVRLVGNVVVESEKKLIRAANIDLWGEDYRYFAGSGDVYIRDKEKNIVLQAESFEFDKELDIMRLTGQIVMQDFDNEVVVKCQYLERFGEEDKIILQIGVRILKENIICRSEFAVYYRETDMLELSGIPVVFKDDDEYRADIITVNLDTEEISMEGQVSGSLQTEGDPDPPPPPPRPEQEEDSAEVEGEEGGSTAEEDLTVPEDELAAEEIEADE